MTVEELLKIKVPDPFSKYGLETIDKLQHDGLKRALSTMEHQAVHENELLLVKCLRKLIKEMRHEHVYRVRHLKHSAIVKAMGGLHE